MAGTVTINGVRVDLDKIARENQEQQKNEQKTHKEYDFVAQSLSLCDVAAEKINIQPHDSNKIVISVSGLQSAVDALSVEERNGVVMIGCSTRQNVQIGGVQINRGIFGGIQINSGNSVVRNIGNMTITDGMTIISGDGNIDISVGETTAKLTLEIKVPVGTDIDCDDICGNVTIGDVDGDLRVDVAGSTDLRAGKAKDVNLDISDSAKIVINQVKDTKLYASGSAKTSIGWMDGDAKIEAAGSCNIQIRSGEIGKLNVEAAGTSKVDVQCTVQRAKLEASGMGKIYVKHVVKSPRQDSSGMASIRVDSVG